MNRLVPCVLVILGLVAYSHASILNCQFADVTWSNVEVFYTCTGSIVDSGNNGTILSINGTHLATRTNADVRGVSIYNQRELTRISSNISSSFNNVTAFDWVFGDLDTVTRDDLEQFPGLRILSLYGNRLSSLRADLFLSTTNLEHIDFGANLLNFVAPTILRPIVALQTAVFQRNPCINQTAATNETFTDLEWYFANQCLGGPLATLECQFSEEFWLASDRFYTCTGAVIGAGNDGEIREVTGTHEGQQDNSHVTAISVYNQRGFQRLPRYMSTFFGYIQAFEWVFGNIQTLSDLDIQYFWDLRILSLYGNEIVTLGGYSLQGTTYLRHIDFGNNGMNHVGPNLFERLDVLEVALFERNRCISFSAGTPETLRDLEQMLVDQCPMPVEPEVCPEGCDDRFRALEDRVEYLEIVVEQLISQINALKKEL